VACDNLPHLPICRALAADADGRQARCVPFYERFTGGSLLLVAALALLGACSGDSVGTPTSDASLDRGGFGSGGSAGGGSGGTSGDAGADATPAATDAADAGDEAPPCVVDPDATVNCRPQDLPPDDDCPDAAPSYATVLSGIIARKCTVCHRTGGLEPVNQFDTLAKIQKNNQFIHMLTQVYTCRMPQACGEPLTTDEKQELEQWLVCGAPNN